MFLPAKDQLAILKDSVPPMEIIEEGELLEKLEKSRAENRPLRIKQGFDASAPDLHIGHAVSIWKLRAFQDLGHTVIFLIGDFTAMIGDPSGKSKTRPRLTREQAIENSETYRKQVFKILDPDKTEIRFNSEWHASQNIYQFLDLASRRTVARILERDDFAKRYQAGEDISLLEFLYPLIQAYDSVALKADVELGGTDQKFNLVLARHIQRSYGQEPQSLFLMPLLKGLDGNDKMSKSLGNYIGVTDEPDNMYGKVMSISDDLLEEYYVLASGLGEVEAKVSAQGDPYTAKHRLASMITSRYHGEEAASSAADAFAARFKQREWPSAEKLRDQDNVLTRGLPVEWLPRLISLAGAASSNGEATRLIKAHAVEVDGEKFPAEGNLELDISRPRIVKVGKRRFFLVEYKPTS
jgi:tyrosyl-tRNA synthetase